MDKFLGRARVAWLNGHDKKQMEWAWRHFGSRRIDIPQCTADTSHGAVVSWLENLPNNADSRELLRNARNAWRQKECRQKNGRKPYNFLLATSAHSDLKKLASLRGKDTTMTAVLELLIAEGLSLERLHQEEQKAQREAQKRSLDDLRSKQAEVKAKLDEQKKKAELLIKDQDRVITNFGLATKELAKELADLLRAKCKAELGVAEQQISKEEQAALDERYQEELAKIQARLKLATPLGAFSPRPYTYKPSRAGTGTKGR